MGGILRERGFRAASGHGDRALRAEPVEWSRNALDAIPTKAPMSPRSPLLPLLLFVPLLASGCDDAADKVSGAVQAAGRVTADTLRQAAQKLEEAGITPEAARAQAQSLLDDAAAGLRERLKELGERVRDDPRVQRAREAVRREVDEIRR